MNCVEKNELWYLFDPNECPGLSDVVGQDYVDLYNKYVINKSWVKCMNARDLWFKILDSQMETGTPYMLYKDSANLKSNQQNLGVIKSSNLCTEIIEYSSPEETAVCNLASIALSKFVNIDKTFNYNYLHDVTKIITNNLNEIIDINFYPTDKTLRSNKLHRPIGIGVQGFADALFKMDIAYHSDEAKDINIKIFETIYHAALEKSNEMSKERQQGMITLQRMFQSHHLDFCYPSYPHSSKANVNLQNGEHINQTAAYNLMLMKYKPIVKEINTLPDHLLGSYSSFVGSPASKGILQFDMWNVTPSDRYDWNKLKQSIRETGLRNSLLVAPMPTASTSQILGNTEAFEPQTSNVFSRRVLAGDYLRINKYLQLDLLELGLWNEDIKNNIIANRGSVQQIDGLSDKLKQKYKIVWEMPMKHIIDMSADRGAFIDQSQSLNLWVEDPNYNTLTSMHFYSFKKGLKTGMYYLRRKPKHQPQQFTIDPNSTYDNNEPCETCSA